VPLCFQLKLGWLVQGWQLPDMIAEDLWILLRELAPQLFRRPSGNRVYVDHRCHALLETAS
jgi:hypothetical protein